MWTYLIPIAALLILCLWLGRYLLGVINAMDAAEYDCGDSERPCLPTREET